MSINRPAARRSVQGLDGGSGVSLAARPESVPRQPGTDPRATALSLPVALAPPTRPVARQLILVSRDAGSRPTMQPNDTSARGEEFRNDLRPLARFPASAAVAGVGSGNAAARRTLSSAELAPLTELNDLRSLASVALTAGVIALAVGFGVAALAQPLAGAVGAGDRRAAARDVHPGA